MAYIRQNFNNGDILLAEQLNHIETGIIRLETDKLDATIIKNSEDNLLKEAVDLNNSPYNGGIGYKANTRLKSTGAEEAYTGMYCTGFIPVTLGDVIYFSNISYRNDNLNGMNPYTYYAVYDANKNVLTSQVVGHLSSDNNAVVYEDTSKNLGNIVQLNTANAVYAYTDVDTDWRHEDMAFFRISAEYIGEDSVITINQPAGGTGVRYLDSSIKVPQAVKNSERIDALESGSVSGGGENIPSYVQTEAESMIDRILAAQGNRTFTFAAISDLHYGNSGYTSGVQHACQALKYINARIKLDMVAVLGDYTDGYPTTTLTDAMADFRTVNSLLNDLRFAPNIRQMGNHDYYADNIPITRRLIQDYSDNVVWGDRQGGYFYVDIADYKLRIISPNCNENNVMSDTTNNPTGDISISNSQCQWFVDTLTELNTKDEAEQWQILIITHQPVDWHHADGVYSLSGILNAYNEGLVYSDARVSCDFSGGNNSARLICNIHGHIHNLLTDKIYIGYASAGVQSNIWRMATPEACIGRANQYNGVFSETTSYPKTKNTNEDTSFVVYCIDMDTHIIKAICYGAGYDRTLNYFDGNMPTYTNLLPLAINRDGSAYVSGDNGENKGWKPDTRLSSSGAESTSNAEGIEVTGFIPVKFEDTIYFENLKFVVGGERASVCYICVYDSDFNLIAYRRADETGGGNYSVDENNCLKSIGLTVGNGFTASLTNAAYFRISAEEITDASIITVNEMIN